MVVEHDEETIRRAEHVIDLGPGAGKFGGSVVAEGTAEQLTRRPESITGRFLLHPLRHPIHPPRPVTRSTACIELKGANLHNLKQFDARVPLGRLTVITGVSGSGKSTLARDLLYANLQHLLSERRTRRNGALAGCRDIEGWEQVGRVLEVDIALKHPSKYSLSSFLECM